MLTGQQCLHNIEINIAFFNNSNYNCFAPHKYSVKNNVKRENNVNYIIMSKFLLRHKVARFRGELR